MQRTPWLTAFSLPAGRRRRGQEQVGVQALMEFATIVRMLLMGPKPHTKVTEPDGEGEPVGAGSR